MGAKNLRSRAPSRRPGKRPRARVEREPRLTEHDIIEHTLRLIRAESLASLSMRRLAQELGVAPMSLYHYVRNKDELLDRVLDSLLARIPTPEPQRENWQAQLRAYGTAILEQLSWHPGIARVATERPPTAEGRRLLAYAGELLVVAGLSERKAALCLATYNTFLYGVLAAQAQMPNLVAVVAPRGAKAAVPVPGRERARCVNQELLELGFREWSQFGIDALLASFASELEAPPRVRRAPRAEPSLGKPS